jgi:hypothetical protein
MLEGFISLLMGILRLELSCPDYSIFCRRARNVKIPNEAIAEDRGTFERNF